MWKVYSRLLNNVRGGGFNITILVKVLGRRSTGGAELSAEQSSSLGTHHAVGHGRSRVQSSSVHLVVNGGKAKEKREKK